MHFEPASGRVHFGPFSFDLDTGDLYRNGSPVQLPPQPTRILALLARNPGLTVTRSRIREELWDKEPPDPDQAINSAIADIRAALDDDARDPEYVQTVPRKGYRLLINEPVGDRPSEALPPAAVGRMSGTARAVTLFGIAASVLLVAFWLLHDGFGDKDARRIAVVPTRVVDAASGTDSLAAHLTNRLVSGLGTGQSGRVEILMYQWDMRFDRENGLIRREGENMNIDYLIESSVDREDEWTVSASVYSVQDGTQLWYRRYSFPLDSPVGFVEQIVNEIDSLLTLNLNERLQRVDES